MGWQNVLPFWQESFSPQPTLLQGPPTSSFSEAKTRNAEPGSPTAHHCGWFLTKPTWLEFTSHSFLEACGWPFVWDGADHSSMPESSCLLIQLSPGILLGAGPTTANYGHRLMAFQAMRMWGHLVGLTDAGPSQYPSSGHSGQSNLHG